ncbi:LysE/ArgO family amino acid transporter [Larsenimonas salina]|uniref:LysE/ArgO family amino acid transporter n=1 Tax=Larsenimonas salina TaxID=1295565 RepID=UPI002073187D|nr:LysE family transporter [Larsenimonas salina]MCM5704339.1 LysE family transporter [Larsenimonas salina]
MGQAFIEGVVLGWGLIVAIGPQNALVLRQGLAGVHARTAVVFCAVTDVGLIAIGSLGLGHWLSGMTRTLWTIKALGAVLLVLYALHALRRAFAPGALMAAPASMKDRRALLLTLAGVTFLNPHVYLDTWVLLAGLASRYPESTRLMFVGGTMLASVSWFCLLGFTARLSAGVLACPRAWQMIDLAIALILAGIGLQLGHEVIDESVLLWNR